MRAMRWIGAACWIAGCAGDKGPGGGDDSGSGSAPPDDSEGGGHSQPQDSHPGDTEPPDSGEETGPGDSPADSQPPDDTGSIPDCGLDDLVWFAEVRDDAGEVCTGCPAGEDLWLVGGVTNPCDVPLEVLFLDGCVVGWWEITDGDGRIAFSDGPVCTEALVTRTFSPGETLEDGWFDPIALDVGDYVLTASFDDEDRHVAGWSFWVE